MPSLNNSLLLLENSLSNSSILSLKYPNNLSNLSLEILYSLNSSLTPSSPIFANLSTDKITGETKLSSIPHSNIIPDKNLRLFHSIYISIPKSL